MACWLRDEHKQVGLLRFLILRGLILSATGLAAAPCSVAVKLKWDSASVGTVVSHSDGTVMAHGIKVAPSGRLPSRLRRPRPTIRWQLESVLLYITALHTMSHIWLCRCCGVDWDYLVFISRSYCYTVWSAIGSGLLSIRPSVRPSVCDAVHYGSQGRCTTLKVVSTWS